MTSDDDVTLEGTLALIKPDAVEKERYILDRIRSEGFLVVEKRRFRFTGAMAAAFYAEHKGKPFYPHLLAYMTSGDVIAMCLARENGIRKWREVLGPTRVSEAMREAPNSLRARYGDPKNDMVNALHGSDSPAASEREIEIIFPHILHGSDDEDDDEVRRASRLSNDGSVHEQLDRSVETQPEDNKDYLQRYVCPTLLKGLSEMYETRPQSPIAWLADWLTDNNPYKQ